MKNQNLVAVPPVLQNKLTYLFAVILIISTPSFSVPSKLANQDNLNPLISKIFSKTPSEKTCLTLKKKSLSSAGNKNSLKSKASFDHIDPAIQTIFSTLTESIKERDHFKIKNLFHPRLAVSTGAIKQVYLKIEAHVGKKVDASVEKAWAVYTKDGSADDIECSEDNIYLSPQYGYDLQFGAWISILGQKEVAKIFVSIVPSNGHFYIGAFHFQMWTHKQKDYLGWIKEADKDFKDKKFVSSYVKYDLAKKLLFGKSFYRMKFEDEINEFLKKNLDKSVWEQKIIDSLPDDKLLYASSMLSSDGAGLLLRFSIPKELSAHSIREHCKKTHRSLAQKPWFERLKGIRCGYNLPWEKNHLKDGVLGSIYVNEEEAAKKPK